MFKEADRGWEFEREWQDRFGRFAQQNNADHLISGWSKSGLLRRLAVFEQLIRLHKIVVPSKILDLGCGAGTYVRYLAGLGHEVVGLDYSLPCLHRALDADPKRNGFYVGGEAYNLPFCSESFDLIVSIGVLQALRDPERALDEMVRILRPRGLLVIEFLNAFEIIALVRSASERINGRMPRICTYSPLKIRHWFIERGLKLVQQTGVYLPPRKFPQIGRVLNQKGVIRLLEGIPGFSLAGAHAFLLAGRKAPR